MTEFTRIAVDTSKHVFTLHGIDAEGRPVLRRNLRRAAFLALFAKLAPTTVAMEACGGSHHWGRELQAMGHQVAMIPPQYVKPFVKRGKNDRNDAEAICTAAGQPGMARVPVKSAEAQAAAMLLSVRELLTRQRTQLVNALRGHAARVRPGRGQGRGRAACGDRPGGRHRRAARAGRSSAGDAWAPRSTASRRRWLWPTKKLMAQHKAADGVGPMSRLLAEIPGVGWLSALTLSLRVDASQFRSGRHLAAWLGLAPRERSTGGKQRLGGISRAGNERPAQLAGAGLDRGDPPRPAGPDLAVAAVFAGAQAAQAGGGGSGQQDRPCCMGDDGERRGLPAARRRLIAHRPQV